MILCSDKKGWGPEAWVSPPRTRSWLRGGSFQLAAPPGPVPRRCHQLSSLWEPGTQDPTGPQAPETAPVDQVLRLCPTQRALPLGHRDRDGAGARLTASSAPGPSHWVALANALEPCRTQDTAPSLPPAPSSPAGPRWAGKPWGDRVCLLPYSLPATGQPWVILWSPAGHSP